MSIVGGKPGLVFFPATSVVLQVRHNVERIGVHREHEDHAIHNLLRDLGLVVALSSHDHHLDSRVQKALGLNLRGLRGHRRSQAGLDDGGNHADWFGGSLDCRVNLEVEREVGDVT